MAAGTWTIYDKAIKKILNNTIPLQTAALRCRIFKAQAAASVSVYTLSLLSQIGTTNRAAYMSDYTLSLNTLSVLAGSTTLKFEANNIVVTASGGNATSLMYAVVYSSLSAGGGDVLMWCKLSTAAFPVTDTNTLTITAPANGYFVIY